MKKCEACNGFNKFNNTGARMLDSINHMTINLLKNHFWCEKNQDFLTLLGNVKMNVIT